MEERGTGISEVAGGIDALAALLREADEAYAKAVDAWNAWIASRDYLAKESAFYADSLALQLEGYERAAMGEVTDEMVERAARAHTVHLVGEENADEQMSYALWREAVLPMCRTILEAGVGLRAALEEK